VAFWVFHTSDRTPSYTLDSQHATETEIGSSGSGKYQADPNDINPIGNEAVEQLQQHSNTIERLFPASRSETWMVHNRNVLRDLLLCLDSHTCRTNQAKVVILIAFDFRMAWDGLTDGEAIYAAAGTLALKNLGYTYFYTLSLSDSTPLYQAMPSRVRAIIAAINENLESILDIPLYKVFIISFWERPAHPLGAQWTLSPEDYRSLGQGSNTWLGYSIEATCAKHRFVPHAERNANEAYILAKLLSFFLPERDCAWPPEVLNAASRETGITYISGSYNDTQHRGQDTPQPPDPMWNAPELPEQYRNEGLRPQFEFLERLAEMRVLIGMGNPITSPTPYDALCLGVPFINPIHSWDSSNPTDRSQWDSQHRPLARLDPPYVYNVFKNDLQGFVNAIKGALENPIRSFVPESMKMKSLEDRVHAILQKDWEGEAMSLGF